MNKSIKRILAAVVLVFLFSGDTFSQEFGFGCLGLTGAYAGYQTQLINAGGLNNYIAVFNDLRKDSLEKALPDFTELQGFRFGLLVYRMQFTGFRLNFTTFYERLSGKKQTLVFLSQGERQNNTLELAIDKFGIGVDIVTPITRLLSWKIVDVNLTVNRASFTKTINTAAITFLSTKYTTNENSLGYAVGTGFIWHIIEDYISLEGTASYTFFSVGRMKDDKNSFLPVSEINPSSMDPAINSGGLNTLIQINLGFPF